MSKEKIRYVELAPPNPQWKISFNEEVEKIKPLLSDNLIDIQHIGSTVITDIYAKPVIDMLVIVRDLTRVDPLNSKFKALDYHCEGEYGIPGRRFFWKSETKRTHHIHLFQQNNTEISRHLAFRDYLNQYPAIAQAYSWIKRCLAEQFPTDIVAYVNGKESFIRTIDYQTGHAKPDQLTAQDKVLLEAYNPQWEQLAAAEIKAITRIIQLPFACIQHLGSTSIKDLQAKPVIDIFIALDSIDEAKQWIEPLSTLGYVFSTENSKPHHLWFHKGKPPYGIRRTHHLHIMPMGQKFMQRIAFRDILNRNSNLRNNYQQLKQQLAAQYPNDLNTYTKKKADFIKKTLQSYHK